MKFRRKEGTTLLLGLVVVGLWFLVPMLFGAFYDLPTEPGAFGDMYGALNALFSGLAFVAIIVTIRFQMDEIRESTRTVELQTRAQLLTSIRELARDYEYRRGIATIRRLPEKATTEQLSALSLAEREEITNVVEFLNHAAHLVFSDGLVTVQDIWDSYFVAYEMCGKKLVPHWIEQCRSNHPHRFGAFEDMCGFVAEVSVKDREQFASLEPKRRRDIVERGKRSFQ